MRLPLALHLCVSLGPMLPECTADATAERESAAEPTKEADDEKAEPTKEADDEKADDEKADAARGCVTPPNALTEASGETVAVLSTIDREGGRKDTYGFEQAPFESASVSFYVADKAIACGEKVTIVPFAPWAPIHEPVSGVEATTADASSGFTMNVRPTAREFLEGTPQRGRKPASPSNALVLFPPVEGATRLPTHSDIPGLKLKGELVAAVDVNADTKPDLVAAEGKCRTLHRREKRGWKLIAELCPAPD